MKFLSQVLFSAGLIGFVLTGCERHEFEDTKVLHLEHGHHGEADPAAHPAEGAHAKVDAHGKVEGAHAKETPATPAAPIAPAVKEVPRATGL